MNITHLGIDLAKTTFDVCGMDRHGRVILRRTLSRHRLPTFLAQLPACRVAMEACGSAHYWARPIQAQGHGVRLIASHFVKPYRKDDKNDRSDAEAICEALTRPSMRFFVAIKTEEQQAVLVLHRARALLSAQRIALLNQIRGLLAEFGILMPQGASLVRESLAEQTQAPSSSLPELARSVFANLHERLVGLDAQLVHYDRRLQCLA